MEKLAKGLVEIEKEIKNEKEALISVVIPAYNEEETIEECIKSFLNQTYKNLEIIVVDDGSTDNTYHIATCYPVKVIRLNKNYGPSHARNVGIKEARGDIIVFAEADAKYSPNYIETIIKPLTRKDIGGSIQYQRHPWSDEENILVRYWNTRFDAIRIITINGKRPVIGAWAFRKEIFEKIGLYDETLRCGEDVDLVNRLKRAGYKIAGITYAESESVLFRAESYEIIGIPVKCWMLHKEPDTFKKLIKRIWWGAIKCKKFRERWGLEPKGFKKLFFIGRNISALLLPIYPVLALIHNVLWLLIFFGVFFAESMFPIIYDRELRLTFKLALKDRDYKLALAMPFICWVEIRTRALGIFYAMLKGE